MSLPIRRRTLLAAGGGAGGLALAGCGRVTGVDRLTGVAGVQQVLAFAQAWTHASQRLLLAPGQLAQEYPWSAVSGRFYANGTTRPAGNAYAASAATGFADWRFQVTGLVRRPLSLSLADLLRLPARTQVTRHDCVEGWSAIAGWTGVPLGLLLHAAGVAPQARYAVFTCADNLDGEPAKGGEQAPGQYYESLGLADAFHPQTLVAYAMNRRPLDVAHGAPLRLRVERQLGYKQAKYLTGVRMVASLKGLAGGQGGYWEDRGYDWYAGI